LLGGLCLCFQVPGDDRLQQIGKNYLEKFETRFKNQDWFAENEEPEKDEFNIWMLNLASLSWFHFFDVLIPQPQQNHHTIQNQVASNCSSSTLNENSRESLEDSFVMCDSPDTQPLMLETAQQCSTLYEKELIIQNQFSVIQKKIQPLFKVIYIENKVLEAFQNSYDLEQDPIKKERLRMTQYIIASALHQFGDRESKNYVKKWVNQLPIQKSIQEAINQWKSPQSRKEYFSKFKADLAYPQYLPKVYHDLIPFSLNALLKSSSLDGIKLQLHLKDDNRLKYMFKTFILNMVPRTAVTSQTHQLDQDFFVDLSKFDFLEKLIVVKTLKSLFKKIREKVEKYIQENQSIFLEDLHEFFEVYGLDVSFVIDTLQALYLCNQVGGQVWIEAQKWFQFHKDRFIKNIKNALSKDECENLTIASLCLCFQSEEEFQNLAKNYIDQFFNNMLNSNKKSIKKFTYTLANLLWFYFLK